MSGLENIISRLEQDCTAECEKVLGEAAKKAKLITGNAEKEAEKIRASITAKAEKEAELISDKAASSAALEERKAILSAKIELIDNVLKNALVKLHTLDAPSYFRVLKMLADRYATGEEGIMLLSKGDLDRLPSDFEGSLRNIKIAEEPSEIKDGFILKYGDIEINCTFEAMMNAAREEMKETAGENLFN